MKRIEDMLLKGQTTPMDESEAEDGKASDKKDEAVKKEDGAKEEKEEAVKEKPKDVKKEKDIKDAFADAMAAKGVNLVKEEKA